MSRFSFCLFTCIGLLGFIGCGEGDDDTPDPAPTKYDVEVSVVDISTEAGIEGATVCVIDLIDPCLATDAEGKVVFEYEAGVDMTITIEADGYWTARLGGSLAPPEGDGPRPLNVQMGGSGVAELLASQAPGVEGGMSTDLGHVVILAGDGEGDGGTVSGVSYSMTPASGVGPFYFAAGDALTNVLAGGAYDADATGTADNGLANYYNVDPGTYTLDATHDTLPCRPFYGLPGGESSFPIEVVAGQISYAVVICQ